MTRVLRAPLTVLRVPLVAYGFLLQQLRRLPGAKRVGRHASLIAAGLFVAALVALGVWAGQKAPQRISLAELAANALSPMQSWIIVTGELSPEPTGASGLRYRLTDPAAPNAHMIVLSSHELPLGQAMVSGTFLGPREAIPAGYSWVGHMSADEIMAEEPPPPWIAVILAVTGVLVGTAGRFSYPMFFAETPRSPVARTATLPVRVKRETLTSDGGIDRGTLRLRPGEPVELRVPGAGAELLRLYSRYTSVDAGELRRLLGSEPVLRVRQPKGDLTITFASRHERDTTFAALIDDVEHHDRVDAAARFGPRPRAKTLEEGTSDS